MPKKKDENDNLFCSFCGKNQSEVRKLIAGPAVYICDECIQLCSEIRADDAVPLLVSMPRALELEAKCPVLKRYSDIIGHVADEEDIQLLDIRRILRELVEKGKATEEELMLDEVHPSPQGHRVIAEALLPVIGSMLQ